eukprot:5364025-Amphidinium_carterae.1
MQTTYGRHHRIVKTTQVRRCIHESLTAVSRHTFYSLALHKPHSRVIHMPCMIYTIHAYHTSNGVLRGHQRHAPYARTSSYLVAHHRHSQAVLATQFDPAYVTCCSHAPCTHVHTCHDVPSHTHTGSSSEVCLPPLRENRSP